MMGCADMLTSDVTRDDDRGLVHVTLQGALTSCTAPLVINTVLKCLAEQPVAVVIDVGGLNSRTNVAVPVFLTLRRYARRDPPVPLVVVAPRSSPGSGLRGPLGRYVPAVATVADAGELARRWPAADRWRHQRLAADIEAPSVARSLVAQACAQWQLSHLLYAGRTLVSELVDNAVQHAGTEIRLTVTQRAHFLCMAVRDGSPALPQVREPRCDDPRLPLDIRGYGLRTVDRLAFSWGAEVTTEGKVVWATLHTEGGAVAKPVRPAGSRAAVWAGRSAR